MSRSTSSSFAPSLANTIAAARPVPTVSPGDCPARTTLPTIPSSRTARAYSAPPHREQPGTERPATAIAAARRAPLGELRLYPGVDHFDIYDGPEQVVVVADQLTFRERHVLSDAELAAAVDDRC